MADGFYGNLRFGLFELSSRERALRRDGVMPPLGTRALDILLYLAELPSALIAKQKPLDVFGQLNQRSWKMRIYNLAS
jgi:DNA-binding winged helix-turn-helix (wHTH) protein